MCCSRFLVFESRPFPSEGPPDQQVKTNAQRFLRAGDWNWNLLAMAESEKHRRISSQLSSWYAAFQ
jgi:hypothetical protein